MVSCWIALYSWLDSFSLSKKCIRRVFCHGYFDFLWNFQEKIQIFRNLLKILFFQYTGAIIRTARVVFLDAAPGSLLHSTFQELQLDAYRDREGFVFQIQICDLLPWKSIRYSHGGFWVFGVKDFDWGVKIQLSLLLKIQDADCSCSCHFVIMPLSLSLSAIISKCLDDLDCYHRHRHY